MPIPGLIVTQPAPGSPPPSLGPAWDGVFIGNAMLRVPGINVPFGVQNAYVGSPLTFTAFAAPMEEVDLGDLRVRLDTIDIRMIEGSFERARARASMVLPGAQSGRVALDVAFLQVPETETSEPSDALLVSLNAPEDQEYRFTDHLGMRIARGSRLDVAYVDSVPAGESRWKFGFDVSGSLRLVERSGGDEVISIPGIQFEHFRFASDGTGVQAPRVTVLGMALSGDTAAAGGGAAARRTRPPRASMPAPPPRTPPTRASAGSRSRSTMSRSASRPAAAGSDSPPTCASR